MATGVIATGRRQLSQVLKGFTKFEDDFATNFSFSTILVGAAGTAEPIGTPVIFDNATSEFVVYVAQSISAAITAGNSPLPNGSVIAILVGEKEGRGFNKEDIDLTATSLNATAIFRGPASVVNTTSATAGTPTLTGPQGGIYWQGSNDAQRAAFVLQLEIQDIAVQLNTEVIAPSFVQ